MKKLGASAPGVSGMTAITMLWTTDEEVGSGTSRAIIEHEARQARAVLVLEPALPGGALKTARKGCGQYELMAHGIAAHAGLDPGFLERVLERERVQHGRKHSHVVAGGAVHPAGRGGEPAVDVAAADHDRHLDAAAVHGGDLRGDRLDPLGIGSVGEAAHQRLARELEQDAAEARRRLASGLLGRRGRQPTAYQA